jgi:hypothetical protein
MKKLYTSLTVCLFTALFLQACFDTVEPEEPFVNQSEEFIVIADSPNVKKLTPAAHVFPYEFIYIGSDGEPQAAWEEGRFTISFTTGSSNSSVEIVALRNENDSLTGVGIRNIAHVSSYEFCPEPLGYGDTISNSTHWVQMYNYSTFFLSNKFMGNAWSEPRYLAIRRRSPRQIVDFTWIKMSIDTAENATVYSYLEKKNNPDEW